MAVCGVHNMKALVLSDSHGTMNYMTQAVEKERPDRIFHLGDTSRDAERLQQLYPQIPLHSVRGNCDVASQAPLFLLLTLEGRRLYLCHGHQQGVKYGLLRLALTGAEAGAEAVLFGHTHRPCWEWQNGLLLANPGTCGSRGGPTYGLLHISKERLDWELQALR